MSPPLVLASFILWKQSATSPTPRWIGRSGLPRSTLSKRVALLEEQLQVRLLQRSSRRFALTEVGQEFFERARAALSEVEAAEAIDMEYAAAAVKPGVGWACDRPCGGLRC